ncbi:conserved hypothetical protein [Chryseobacterium sp. 8AT]|nr:conserved hypothetical protein [Chryseobacterium sp. 8AT]
MSIKETFFYIMINLAESEYQIDIRKIEYPHNQ